MIIVFSKKWNTKFVLKRVASLSICVGGKNGKMGSVNGAFLEGNGWWIG
jgi:hypothetical protein